MSLDYTDYAGQLPPGAAVSMGPLNALYAGYQDNNRMQQQQTALQSQQAALAPQQLQAAVATAQNNPQGISTLAAGEQGAAQSTAAAGATAAAVQPQAQAAKLAELKSQTSSAQLKDTANELTKAYSTLTSNGPAGFSMLSPEMQNVAKQGGGDPVSNIKNTLEMVTHAMGVYNPETQSKIAEQAPALASAENRTKMITDERKYGVDTRSSTAVDVANIRAEAAKVAKANPAQLSFHEAAQKTSEANRYQQSLVEVQKLALVDPDGAKELSTKIESEHQKNMAQISSIYDEARKGQTSAPAAEKPDVADVTLESNFNPTPDQDASISAAQAQIAKTPQFKQQILDRLIQGGIRVKK